MSFHYTTFHSSYLQSHNILYMSIHNVTYHSSSLRFKNLNGPVNFRGNFGTFVKPKDGKEFSRCSITYAPENWALNQSIDIKIQFQQEDRLGPYCRVLLREGFVQEVEELSLTELNWVKERCEATNNPECLDNIQRLLQKDDRSLLHLRITIKAGKLVSHVKSLADLATEQPTHPLIKCFSNSLRSEKVDEDTMVTIRVLVKTGASGKLAYSLLDSIAAFREVNQEWRMNPDGKVERFYSDPK